MTNDDGRDDADGRAGAPGRRGGGFRLGLGTLTDLLGALVDLQVSRPPPGESIDRGSEGRERREHRDRGPHERPSRHRDSGVDRDRVRVDTRFEDDGDELVVVADLPGTSRDDVSAGIEPRRNELVIGWGGTPVRRVEIPWEAAEATRVWFNNGVLEVRLRPTDADD